MKFEHVLLEQHGVTFLFEQKAIQKELDNVDTIPDIPTADQITNFNSDSFTDQIIDELKKKLNIRERQCNNDIEEKFKLAQSDWQNQIDKYKQETDEKKKIEQELVQIKESLQKMKTDFQRERQCKVDAEERLKQAQSDLEKQIDNFMTYRQEHNHDDFKGSDYSLVAAIHIGTTLSGYAYSCKSSFETNPVQIVINQNWTAGSRSFIALKTPTSVLLKPDKTFFAFGYDAEDCYAELALDGEEDDWYFFRGFPMSVYNNTTLSRSTEISDDSGKKLLAHTVFSHGIRFLKDHLLECLMTRGISVNEGGILWVLTVPAIWNASAKQLMTEAAAQAGIKENHLMIAMEPEAAALYCRIRPNETFVSGSKPGSKCLVADLGGRAVDFTVLEVLDKNNFRILQEASGGAWGETKVVENLMQFMAVIVGDTVIKRFKKECKLGEIDIIREFQTKKRAISTNSIGKITFKIPSSLVEYAGDVGARIKKSNFATKMTFLSFNTLRMEVELFKQLFTEVTDNIVQNLKDIFMNPVCRDVDTIYMVGGFSECPMVQEAIKSNFKDKNVIIPEEADLAVVKGAVLFGRMSI